MNLPEELLDEILVRIPSYDRVSLKNCSLVSKSWLQPSRRLFFTHISIRPETYQLWLDVIPPTNTALLRHVRSLKLFVKKSKAPDPRCHVHALRDYLPSFCQLRILTLRDLDVDPNVSEHPELFSAFQYTLLTLSLIRVSITWSAFVALVGYFPNLQNLVILEPSFQVDDKTTFTVPHPLRGRLLVGTSPTGATAGFPSDLFAKLMPEYEELAIIGAYDHHLVTAVERYLKFLKVGLCDVGSTPGLSGCTQLCQLAFTMSQPREQERILISSITSAHFQKLVFDVQYFFWDSLDNPCWTPFDDTICELVDRLRGSGCEHVLEVEFQAEFVEPHRHEYHQPERFLPKFKEKGRVRIVEILGDGFWEWPKREEPRPSQEI